LARRTGASFNDIVVKRLCFSRVNRPPTSLSKLAGYTKGKSDKNIAVVVGPVTDDARLAIVPKLTVAALHVTEAARARITKAGGRVLTLDQLALERPTGANTLLVQGPRRAREAFKRTLEFLFRTRYYLYSPIALDFRGIHGKHAKPYIRPGGAKLERARGRRASRGYKR